MTFAYLHGGPLDGAFRIVDGRYLTVALPSDPAEQYRSAASAQAMQSSARTMTYVATTPFRNKIREEVMVMQPQGDAPVVEMPSRVREFLRFSK